MGSFAQVKPYTQSMLGRCDDKNSTRYNGSDRVEICLDPSEFNTAPSSTANFATLGTQAAHGTAHSMAGLQQAHMARLSR